MKVIGKERKEKSVKIVWQKKRNTPTLYGSIREWLKKKACLSTPTALLPRESTVQACCTSTSRPLLV